MVEVLKDKYWSKSEAFLLPLTGLKKTQKYDMKSYLFWQNYPIEDYNLILTFNHNNQEEFIKYCRRVIFPILDRNGYLIETYDFEKGTVMVLEIAEWAKDIEMFLKGKYSKMSRDAKNAIQDYHTFFDRGPKILIEISASLNPGDKFPVLGKDVTALEYVADNYGLPLEELKRVGELGGIFDTKEETLEIVVKESFPKGLLI